MAITAQSIFTSIKDKLPSDWSIEVKDKIRSVEIEFRSNGLVVRRIEPKLALDSTKFEAEHYANWLLNWAKDQGLK